MSRIDTFEELKGKPVDFLHLYQGRGMLVALGAYQVTNHPLAQSVFLFLGISVKVSSEGSHS